MIACQSADARPKKRYVSERAARRDLARSPKWRRRRDQWPVPFHCPDCHGFHLAHAS